MFGAYRTPGVEGIRRSASSPARAVNAGWRAGYAPGIEKPARLNADEDAADGACGACAASPSCPRSHARTVATAARPASTWPISATYVMKVEKFMPLIPVRAATPQAARRPPRTAGWTVPLLKPAERARNSYSYGQGQSRFGS
jgi:hypothetical protein